MRKKLFFFLALLCLIGFSPARAASFIKSAGNYRCMPVGKNVLQFSLPTFDYYKIAMNVHVTEPSYVEASIDGGKTWKHIIEWKHPGRDEEDPTYMRTLAPGELVVQMARYGKSDVSINSNDSWKTFYLGADQDDDYHYTTTVQWHIPYAWQGNKIMLRFSAHWDDEGSGTVTGNFDTYDSPEPPDVAINFMDPMLAFDKEHVGELMIPYYMQAVKCTKMTLNYTNAATGEKISQAQTPNLTGYVYLPMNFPMKDVYIEADLVDSDKNNLTGMESEHISVNPLHTPKNFTATMDENARVTLKWTIEYPDSGDIMEDDYWEIQRNTTGETDNSDSNWKTLGMLGFERQSGSYEYLDEHFFDEYEGKNVSYRIRRSSTAIWDWGESAGTKTVTINEKLQLASVKEATVEKETWTDDSHTVTFNWTMNEPLSTIDNSNVAVGDIVTTNGRIFKNQEEMSDDPDAGTAAGVLISVSPTVVLANGPIQNLIKPAFDGNNYTISLLGWNQDRYFDLFQQKNIKGYKMVPPYFNYWHAIFKAFGDDSGMNSRYIPSVGDKFNAPNTIHYLTSDLGLSTQRLYLAGYDDKSYILNFADKVIEEPEDQVFKSKNLSTCYDLFYKEGKSCASYAFFVPDEKIFTLWDSKAKLQLVVHMKSDSGTFTNVVDLSSDENALKNHTYTYSLPRKCVDYEFELVVRRGSSYLPICNTFKDDKGNYPDSLAVSVKKKETGDDAKYWFLNTDSVKNLRSTVRQSSVLLEWDSNGGEHDYYRVLRRDKMSVTQDWDTLVTNLPLMRYEDTTPYPQHTYEYKVESVFQCEGMIVNSATTTGACEPTGMIKGYLRLADGTGMGGYTIIAISKTDKKEYTTTTDDSGYFELAGLEYQGTGQFEVMVQTDGGSFNVDSQNLEFTTKKNLFTNVIFYVDNYFVYSGNVYYDGSSIPVPGVEFKMDGVTITDANGNPYQTDSQGAFEVSIPKGVHQVQAVKEGHVFKNDGYLLVPDAAKGKERDWDWVANKSEVYLWDCTEVVLHGRVIGGNAQAGLELGKSRSVNNLGDNINIVMQLEGDNASYIVRDQQNDLVKERTDSIAFGQNKQNLTVVHSTLHSITVKMDNETGEYEMRLRPTRYKITSISATGYPTLFQEGKVGETLDLSKNVQGDTVVYNRIYHSVPTLDVVQFNGNNESYYGVKYSIAQDNIGQKDTVMVWNAADNSYSLGHPVFMAGSPYGWTLQACEKYYYNNDNHGKLDIVKLDTGTVVIRNRLVSDTDEQVIQLDNTGKGAYIFTPDNTTFTLENDMALRDVSITLEYDSTYFDVKPLNGERLKGYVMVTKPKPQGKTVMAAGIPILFDILRDPPGGGSSSYIEAGSKLSYTYNATMDAQIGFKLRGTNSVKQSYYTGTVVVPSFGATGVEYGTIDGAYKKSTFALDVVLSFNGNWTYNYNMDVTERVQTSSGKKWVGPKADLFIGTNQNVILQDAIAVRVVPERQYKILTMQEGGSFKTENGVKVSVKNATVKKLAEGKDANGNKVYLVRDEVMGVSTKVNSTFIHSQHYVENELMPALIKARNSLILPKDSMAFAQQLANKNGIPYYVSNVDRSDPKFGVDEYVQVLPEGKDTEMYTDSINAINKQLLQWAKFLIRNEEEKINVQTKNLVKNYDFDGATSIQYSETFTVGENSTRQLKWPIVGNGGLGVGLWEGLVGKELVKILGKAITEGTETAYLPEGGNILDDTDNLIVTDVGAASSEYTLKFLPVLNVTLNDKYGLSKSNSKKIGFTLSTSSKSSLNVDVYRLAANENEMDTANEGLSNAFYNFTVEGLKNMDKTPIIGYMESGKTPVYSNFVFRTRGGATCQPYEDERVTKWYNPGTVIDAKTKAIDNLKIWAEQTTVSNVPFDEPARFTVYMANESDYAEASTLIFKYFLSDTTNGKGAKVFIDGNPLTGTGESITLFPVGTVAKKQVEIYPNSDFDYENVGISFYDPDDPVRISTVYLTAHFVPTAGKVKISTPGDKWVINTESSYDNKQKMYYMPVKIEGFNVNYRGFDHIELQYKLSTQGDKDWVNVCSFYNDKELMEKASGVCDMIPDNGAIIASFYGEIDPIEQYYDLRAVVYCRHGNGFLTASSDILTGIKDTRRPQVFGTPTPVNGILGIGDDIQITFSEPIASNYLRKANNFEVLGTPVGNDISLSTSLQFSGQSVAFTNGECNLTGKSFTIDMMVDPVDNGKQMAFFVHGGDKRGMLFGVTPDRRLIVEINDQPIISDKKVEFNGLHQVAFSVQQGADEMTVSLYDGKIKIGGGTVKGVYDGNSYIVLGYSEALDESTEWNNFEGNMLEARIWNRCLSAGELSKYSQKVLTGYEHGLMSYYRLNEGEGDYSYDHAAGANDLNLYGHTWKRPQGVSMKIDGTQGIKLAPKRFERSEHEDYTLMCWFRTDKKSGTILSNGEAKTEQMADQHFNIGVRDSLLVFRSNGYEVVIPDTLSMTAWHHYAMTVQRSRNVANIYLDNRLYASFPADSVGGISGNGLAIGATYDENGQCKDVLTGYVDEIGLFASALPQNLIKTYTTETPKGTETALLAYLDFGMSQKQDDNSQNLMPTGVSLKRYIDNQGNIIQTEIDTIIPFPVANAFADKKVYAPMARLSQLDNVKYSFVADGNKLLINLDVPDTQIEKTNVYVTVRDVADLNGNVMDSPLTMNVYVYRNPLRWDKKHEDVSVSYGYGVEITATIKNLSGENQFFELRDIPIWITPSITEGTIGPLDEQKVTFTVSPFINIGTYNEVVSLVGENGMAESLALNVRVTGEAPDWKVSYDLKNENQTMQMVARVKIDSVIAQDSNDILVAFGENQEVLGVANIDVDDTANAYEALAYMIIYGHANRSTKLSFGFYDASSGKIYKLEPEDGKTYTFERNAVVGTAENPVVLSNTYDEVTTLDLASGWNWVSFTAAPLGPTTIGELLYGAAEWMPGDIVEIVHGKTAFKFFCEGSSGSRRYRWTEEDKVVEINPTLMYRIFSVDNKKAFIGGLPCYFSPITVKKGWNRIAYLSTINLPIAQAMSGYVTDASEGDVLKSQDAFSILSRDGSGNLIWKGNLRYMETGKGYMLKRLKDSEHSYYYPLYYGDNRYSGVSNVAPRHNVQATTMNIVANVVGVETIEGDTLVAYNGAERCGVATADEEGVFYLNVGVDEDLAQNLSFCIERNNEVVAVTRSKIGYKADAVLGSPDQPTLIDFADLDEFADDGNWYTLSGIKLAEKPQQSGIYIHNGKAQFIK